MRILWLATKLPWPPVDGGRLVAQLTLEALADLGARVTVLSPISDASGVEESAAALEAIGGRLEAVSVTPRPRLLDAALSPLARRPWTVRRHAHRAVRRRAQALVSAESFDLVHAEQVQAFDAGAGLGLPLVLRAQNVESDLWHALARRRRILAAPLRVEGSRLAAYEAEAVRTTSATVALTEADAGRLRELAGVGADQVQAIPAPFPGALKPASGSPRPAVARLEGDPAVVLFGSPGWWPNRDGARWFLESAWPAVRAAHPRARLHLFGFDGAGSPGVDVHPAPRSSAEAMPPGSILAVPLFVSSGVRMKILEAWARGVAVLASPAAARGLRYESGRELVVADGAEQWAQGVTAVREAGERLIEAGRTALGDHAPAKVAQALAAVYRRRLDAVAD